MLDLVFNSYTVDKKYDTAFLKAILDMAIKEINNLEAWLPGEKNLSISLNLIGTGRIKELNKKHRGKNRVTDVLSFPMHKKADFLKNSKHDTMDLGDIFIALPVVKKEARREFLTSGKETKNPAKDQKMIDDITKEKLAQKTVHGFLHLLGYDHEDAKDGGKMLRLQKEIVKKWLDNTLNSK